MYHNIDEFLKDWAYEQGHTQTCLDLLTDASLRQRVGAEDRSLARIAWHIAQTIPEMMAHAGVSVAGPREEVEPPASAKAIADGYRTASASLAANLPSTWSNATLETDVPMYGQTWKRGMVLSALVAHQTHHRGQMTVLMRQAGIKPPAIYGPVREDWAGMNLPAPKV